MSRMSSIIKFTKSHWKKLVIAAVPITYGANYVKTEYQISNHMRHVCNDVQQFASPKSNNVLVVLNPVANKKKCEKMFKKYCEPILHMSGYTVEIVKTKHIGHATSLMETLQKLPDVVVIAGGDGTSSEVVTGILRRNKECCPILFLPLGERNETVSKFTELVSKGKFEYVKCLSSCMLALVRESLQYRNVIKYEVIEGETKQEESHKPIFGLNKFSWGLLKDIEVNKDKYWYFGGLRSYAAALFTALSNKMNWDLSAKLVYTPPCPGCSKCMIKNKNKSNYSFSKIFATKSTAQPAIMPMVNNELCGQINDCQIKAKQINIACNKNSESFFELHTEIIEEINSRVNFIKSVFTQEKLHPSLTLKSRTIEITPITSELLTYYIDGEEFDARPIQISFLPNAVRYFF